METKKHLKKILAAVCVAVLLALLCTVPKAETARADGEDEFSYSISSYDITCTINTDCSMDVTEAVTLYYDGRFTRTIPTDGKTRIKDVKLYRAAGEEGLLTTYEEARYSVSTGKNSVTVKSKSPGSASRESFVVTYTVENLPLTKRNNRDFVYVINIGAGWPRDWTENEKAATTLTVKLPKGFVAEESSVFHGHENGYPADSFGMCENYYFDTANEIVYTPSAVLGEDLGISLWLFFEKGVMSSGTGDVLPWLLLIIGLLIAAGAVAVRLTTYKGKEIPAFAKKAGDHVRAVAAFLGTRKNTAGGDADAREEGGPPPTPPLTMDPLTCRRVLGKKIEDRDVVTLLLFWAEKGYIKINTKSESNPVLIKCAESLPEECPVAWKRLYFAIFDKTNRAGVKSVGRYIYPRVAAVREEANKKKESSYNMKATSTGCAVAVLAALFASFLPAFLPMRVSPRAFSPIYFLAAIPALLVFVFFAAIFATRQKKSSKANVALTVAALVFSAVCAAAYCVFIPSGALALAPRIIVSVLTIVAEIAASTFVLRTNEYDEKLGEAVSVESFIRNTSTDDMKKIAEETPRVYYEFLSYALLLRDGVAWSEKFKSTAMPGPSWLGTDGQTYRFSEIRETVKKTYDAMTRQILRGADL